MDRTVLYIYRSCSVMVTKAMKLLVHSVCADVNARGGFLQLLRQQSFGSFYGLCTSALASSALYLYVTTLWLSCCGS